MQKRNSNGEQFIHKAMTACFQCFYTFLVSARELIPSEAPSGRN